MEIRIDLFSPGMTYFHKVGLAGLYMCCENLQDEWNGPGTWDLKPHAVTLRPMNDPQKFFEQLCQKSFGIDADGLLEFPPMRAVGLADELRVHFTNAVLDTFLQHTMTKTLEKTPTSKSIVLEEEKQPIVVSYKKVIDYSHRSFHEKMFSKNKMVEVELAGWLLPGAGARHLALPNTKYSNSSIHALLLAFCPIAALYYRIRRYTREGVYDKKLDFAIVLPEITDLAEYSQKYRRLLKTSGLKTMHASGLGDAGMQAMLQLEMLKTAQQGCLLGCEVITLGQMPWAKQQKTRSVVLSMQNISREMLEHYELVQLCLPAKLRVKDQKKSKKEADDDAAGYWVDVSNVRGLFADNLAAGNPWYQGFYELMQSSALARKTRYGMRIGKDDQGGFTLMMQEANFIQESQKLFIQAVHEAIRCRYGALAARRREKNENIDFGREFERMRVALMRAKNRQTLRAEIADLFVRAGVNHILQENWQKLLPLLDGEDWQQSRDLALIALASYKGKGSDEISSENVLEENNNGEKN